MCWFLAFQPGLHPHKRKGGKNKDKEKRINRSRIFSIWNKTEKLVTTSIRPNKCFTVPLQARNSQRFVSCPASRTEWPHHWCQARQKKKKKMVWIVCTVASRSAEQTDYRLSSSRRRGIVPHCPVCKDWPTKYKQTVVAEWSSVYCWVQVQMSPRDNSDARTINQHNRPRWCALTHSLCKFEF